MRTKIKTALSGVGVPVFWGDWYGTTVRPAQYITLSMRKDNTLYGDNETGISSYTIYVEIWSNVDYEALEALVIAGMSAAGFEEGAPEDVSDGNGYHQSQTWYGVM